MTFNDFWRREKHVALHAQPRRFRIAKWIIILALAGALYWWKGWIGAVSLFLFCAVTGTGLHLFLRWKTKRWTVSWGPYKRIALENEQEGGSATVRP